MAVFVSMASALSGRWFCEVMSPADADTLY
jgi:hypothetical protein